MDDGRKLLERRQKARAKAKDRLADTQRQIRDGIVAGRDVSKLRKLEADRITALRKATDRVEDAKRIIARRSLNETVAFDGTPVFRGLALALNDARRNGWSGRLSSADRREGVAERFGKMSQALLSLCWQTKARTGICLPKCGGNCNPANPAGFSSHELRHDGSGELSALGRAYRKIRGAVLSWWQLGLDATEADELRSVLNRLGYSVRRTYADDREQHHSNFTVSPEGRLRERKII
jgi:hypothetical protein